jgi:hypothetical protein
VSQEDTDATALVIDHHQCLPFGVVLITKNMFVLRFVAVVDV